MAHFGKFAGFLALFSVPVGGVFPCLLGRDFYPLGTVGDKKWRSGHFFTRGDTIY